MSAVWRLQHGRERGRVDVERQLGRVSRHRRRVGRSDVHLLAVRRAPRLLQFREARVSLCAPCGRELWRSGRAAHRARPGSAAIYGAVAGRRSRRWRARIATRRRPSTRGSSRPSRRPSGSARRSRSTAPTAVARSPTSICRTTCRGRSRSCITSRPAMSPAGSDRCPTRWTSAWRRSSGAGAPRSASCSRATSSVSGPQASSAPAVGDGRVQRRSWCGA